MRSQGYNRRVTARFYAPAAAAGATVALPDDEAQHLTRVLRLAAGAPVRVFDGAGHEFNGVVERVGKSEVLVAVGEAGPASAPELRVELALAQAVLKADKMDDVVRDAVMMGVAAIQPIVTARTEMSLAALERSRRRERWQRIAVSSAKQCGRATVPAVREPAAFAPSSGLMFVEPGAFPGALGVRDTERPQSAGATIIIGPEGGWAPEEIERAAGHCRLVTLRGPTLRADAMALVAIAALLTAWNEY
jgi:16S rRNA (uracil1498-N3)-methyltransferase